MKPYKTTPIPSSNIPSGIPFIIANEAAERFSYYGMRAILVVFMTQYLMNSAGQLQPMSELEAQGYFHLFGSAVYFMPLFGALLSDGLWGKYRTIIYLSLFYCAGHLALALDDTRSGLLIGLSLIALGAGGIKPCVSAHVGDQFGAMNQHLLGKVFGWFYFAINLGAFGAMLLIPWLLDHYGPSPAFATPGILMLLATLVFWSGRYRFVHVPPKGTGFVRQMLSQSGLQTLARLGAIYVFVAMFWALFEQIGSSWVLQAQKMDRLLFGIELLPSQIQAANPLLIMLLSPLFAYYVYPLLERLITLTHIVIHKYRHTRREAGIQCHGWQASSDPCSLDPGTNPPGADLDSQKAGPAGANRMDAVSNPCRGDGLVYKGMTLTALRKIAIGLFVTAAAFALAAWIQMQLDAGLRISIAWQLLAYLLLTSAEVMVSITCLEFSYTQAPNTMKSFIMAFYFLSVAAGNLFTGAVNFFIQNPDGSSKLQGAAYFWLFTGLMLATAVAFAFSIRFYQERTYLQDEQSR